MSSTSTGASENYKRFVLLVLTAVYTLNQVDQGLIGLLLQPIKEDLSLSDSQLGFLTGIAFALFYAVLGIPIARCADRGNRSTITAIAIGLWGGTVMLCLLVKSFQQMVLARVAAGIGEAGCMPSTYSLLGDYFSDRTERTRAMSVYMLAGPLAVLISFVGGGWLNARYGWRETFFIMGIPGLVLALVVKVTIRDPRAINAELTETRASPKVLDVLCAIWRQKTSRHLCLANILLFTMGLGLSPWYAAFMIRTYAIGTDVLGLWLGCIFGIGGIVGVSLGGYVASRWFANNERGQMRASAVTVAALVPFMAMFLLLPNMELALSALVPLVVVVNFFYGPTFALFQRLMPTKIRATSVAVLMFLVNLIGMGCGPQIVGVLSDSLGKSLGADALRYSMLVVSTISFWSAFHFWKAGSRVEADLAATEEGEAKESAPVDTIAHGCRETVME